MKRLSAMILVCVLRVCDTNAQITIQQTDIQAIFTPGGSFRGYSPPDTITTVNVGRTGGPNVYDFTSIPFMANPLTNIYSVSQVPYLVGHYPDNGITFGQSPSFIENGPVFLFGGDSMKIIGGVFVSPDSQRYRHSTPHEPLAIFPATYGDTLIFTESPGAGVETTYVGGVPVRVTTGWNTSGTVTFDGYGTLRVGSYELQCLRRRHVEVPPHTFQGFTYFTREGLIFSVESTRDQPDTGVIQITGMFYLIGGSLVGVPWQSHVPERFALLQNYPNPFNPSTVIEYYLPHSSFVSLRIFTVLGQHIATLVDEKQVVGDHKIQWRAGGLPSGVYFYRLDAEGFGETRKLILLR